MAKGASMNQASQGNMRAGGPAPRPAGPVGAVRPAAPARGPRRSAGSGTMQVYADDAPGVKIGPTTVLVLSLLFIGFVVFLHIWGKFRRL